MLSRKEATQILGEYGSGATWTRHCLAVADAATRVGRALKGLHGIDGDLLWSTALLHDIGRCETHDPVMHGVAGYRLMTGLGHTEAAFVCVSHVLFGLDASEAAELGLPARDFMPLTYEQRIVALVDYLIEADQPTTLELRFFSLRVRNAENHWFLGRLDRAHAAALGFMTQLAREVGQPIEQLVAAEPYCADR
jgi:uncharacterized protein (TIGR00295 family)